MIQVSEEELGDKPFQQGLRRILLEAARNYYKGFIDQRQEDKNAIAELEATQQLVERILEELGVIQGMTQLNAIGYFPIVMSELKLSPGQRKEVDELSKKWETRRAQIEDEARHVSTSESTRERRNALLDYAREGEVAQSLKS